MICFIKIVNRNVNIVAEYVSVPTVMFILRVLDVTFWSFACVEGKKTVRLKEVNRLMHFSLEKAIIK